MPRQTAEKSIIFPDGFKFSIDTGDGFEDVGLLSGGSTATFNYDEFDLDAGNYEDLLSYAKNPTVALAPSAVWNWDPAVIKALFPGFFTSAAASAPETGTDVTYAGTSNQVSLTRSKLRLTHYSDDALTTVDWQFTLHNAKIDAGASFNFKGVNEDGLDEITVSFTGKPDPASTYALFTFFKAS